MIQAVQTKRGKRFDSLQSSYSAADGTFFSSSPLLLSVDKKSSFGACSGVGGFSDSAAAAFSTGSGGGDSISLDVICSTGNSGFVGGGAFSL